MRGVILAVPNKGRLRGPAMEVLERANIRPLDNDRVYLSNTTLEGVQLLSIRAADIPIYIYYGIADLGITGRDVVAESGLEVYELADMGFGECSLVVAVKSDSKYRDPSELPHGTRVATEFPNLTKQFFNELGIQVEVITLRGAVEIAPLLGLADCVVDLSSTGRTLERNGLRAIGTILRSTAKLICNKVAYKTRYEQIKMLEDLLVRSA
ncbi:MAG: ATP phosphoribosyltransferase [Candidatus Methanomethyliaceae archaeon]|nr:ATP phosphoribosyltransferase [Candidatus Methanomethyliaceae archaeon]